jgi:hypothetical protein
MKLSLPQMLALGAGGLGVLNLFLGFAPLATGISFYDQGFGWVPALFAAAGIATLPVILPGDKDKKAGVLPVALALAAMLAFLFTVFSVSGSMAAGGVMVLIFGILQAGATVAAFLFEEGIIKPPAPNPYGAAPGGYPPHQPGAYPQSGAFPAAQPPGSPTVQQPQPGQQQFGGPGQQTQFAPQQGQFGAPGTPPGGYPQQPPQ